MSDAVARREPEPRFGPDGTAWMEAGAGEPLVLIHGVGMNRAVWAPQLTYFAHHYRVIAYDVLGHGDSPRPPEQPKLTDLGQQLAALLDELAIERAHLVGHSMGALIALDFALRRPEQVRSLVALNAVYRRSRAQREAVLERARRLHEDRTDDDLEETLERWFEPAQRARSPERVERVRHWLQSVDRVGYARIYDRFARADEELDGRLASLAMPALFATGEDDPHSTPGMSRCMAEECPQGELEVLPGQRHMMAYMEPEAINPRIHAFLERASGTQSAAGRSSA